MTKLTRARREINKTYWERNSARWSKLNKGGSPLSSARRMSCNPAPALLISLFQSLTREEDIDHKQFEFDPTLIIHFSQRNMRMSEISEIFI